MWKPPDLPKKANKPGSYEPPKRKLLGKSLHNGAKPLTRKPPGPPPKRGKKLSEDEEIKATLEMYKRVFARGKRKKFPHKSLSQFIVLVLDTEFPLTLLQILEKAQDFHHMLNWPDYDYISRVVNNLLQWDIITEIKS